MPSYHEMLVSRGWRQQEIARGVGENSIPRVLHQIGLGLKYLFLNIFHLSRHCLLLTVVSIHAHTGSSGCFDQTSFDCGLCTTYETFVPHLDRLH